MSISSFSQNTIDHDKVCGEIMELYDKKNADFGDAFRKGFEKYGLTMSAVQLGDKFSRFENLVLRPQDQQLKDDSIRDTLLDLADYAIMTVMELDRKEKTKSSVLLEDILAAPYTPSA